MVFDEFLFDWSRTLKLLDISKNQLSSAALISALREMEGLGALRAKKNRLGDEESDATEETKEFTPAKTNMTGWKIWWKMYFLLKMGDFPLSC